MATLVLTAVGTAVGGPIGGAIGAMIGQQIDGKLFAPKGRQGPRLNELAVQTSSYGSAIPKLFGTMRVAGTVIWAADLIERSARGGGGKGRPAMTTYNYAASFAVALSGRPVRAVRRIWADGALLRGAGGDWKTPVTGFRLHAGDEAQAVDPLIASAEGMEATPAYRGIAYVVFEELALADYGNRIPSLTFEVEADDAPVTAGAIAARLSDGAVSGDAGPALAGYAASGDSVRGALEGLGAALPLVIAEDAGRLVLGGVAPPTGATLPSDGAATTIRRQAAGLLPDEVAIRYYEPARDGQSGLQRARRGGPGVRVETIDVPAALTAGAAKALAEGRLARVWTERTGAQVRLPWRHLRLAPGRTVRLAGESGLWRVAATVLEGMALTVDLVACAADGGLSPPAAAGRVADDADLPHGPTEIALIDLPLDPAGPPGGGGLWIAAAGPSRGWRRAMLSGSLDGGARWETLAPSAAPAVMGVVIQPPAPGIAALRDDRPALEVALLHDGMALLSHSDVASSESANLAMVGRELIQFSRAERIGPARWRLGGLLRGRRGTEAAMAGQAAGARFVLIEPETLAAWPLPPSAVGATARVMATGVGDDDPVLAALPLAGDAAAPPSPVHLRARRAADGAVHCDWARRDRAGWGWRDGADTPLSEPQERYRLTLADAAGRGRTVETGVPAYAYPVAARAEDGVAAGAPLTITVRQLGGGGASALRSSSRRGEFRMSDASARFALPWLQPGQAQKEMYHNEALARLDLALHPVVQSVGDTTPPAAPLEGQCWATGATPGGEWTGQGHRIAGWTGGGWRFVALPEGTALWSLGDGMPVRRTAAGWAKGVIIGARVEIGGQQVVGPRRPAIADPAGGGIVDAPARAALSAVLQTLRDHGLIAT